MEWSLIRCSRSWIAIESDCSWGPRSTEAEFLATVSYVNYCGSMELPHDQADPSRTRIDYVGPFSTTHVVVDERRVPFLESTLRPGGIISLTLDGRYGIDLSAAEAERVVPFLADAIAVAMGYASHPRCGQDPIARPVFPRVIEVTSETHGDAGRSS